jgi:hypothetical protein
VHYLHQRGASEAKLGSRSDFRGYRALCQPWVRLSILACRRTYEGAICATWRGRSLPPGSHTEAPCRRLEDCWVAHGGSILVTTTDQVAPRGPLSDRQHGKITNVCLLSRHACESCIRWIRWWPKSRPQRLSLFVSHAAGWVPLADLTLVRLMDVTVGLGLSLRSPSKLPRRVITRPRPEASTPPPTFYSTQYTCSCSRLNVIPEWVSSNAHLRRDSVVARTYLCQGPAQ